jgi:hypothetical protein
VCGSQRWGQSLDQSSGDWWDQIADNDLAIDHRDQPHLHQWVEMNGSPNLVTRSPCLGDTKEFCDGGWPEDGRPKATDVEVVGGVAET